MDGGTFVLIVEDNPGNRALTERQLEILGYEAMAVPGGAEAVEAVRRSVPKLILMDCNMPGINGPETSRAIRGLPGAEDVPIVAVTADTNESTREAFRAAGANEVIHRPVMLDDLKAAMDRWLADPSDDRGRSSGGTGGAGSGTLARLRSEIDEATVQRIATLYLERLDERVAAIGAAIDADNPQALREAAHALKSATSAFDAAEMWNACVALESLGRSGTLEGHEAELTCLREAAGDLRGLLEDEVG